MARPIRIEYEQAFYHITSRGNARGRIYRDDGDREMFLEAVHAAHQRFGFIIHAFVLMDNHYHLLMETPHANLCASMRHINGVYTQAYNRRHKVVGHLLQGRYKAFVVDREAYYLELIRHIHLNPWRAQMVQRLDAFKYSSHAALVDREWAKRWQAWYDRAAILRNFGRREAEAMARYREFVNGGKSAPSPVEQAIGGYALGDRSFADWLWEKFIEKRDHWELAGAKSLRKRLEVADVLIAVGKECGVARGEIFKSNRGGLSGNARRGLALYVLNRHSGMTQKEIGGIAAGMSRAAVSQAVRRFERTLAEDEQAKLTYGRILGRIK